MNRRATYPLHLENIIAVKRTVKNNVKEEQSRISNYSENFQIESCRNEEREESISELS